MLYHRIEIFPPNVSSLCVRLEYMLHLYQRHFGGTLVERLPTRPELVKLLPDLPCLLIKSVFAHAWCKMRSVVALMLNVYDWATARHLAVQQECRGMKGGQSQATHQAFCGI